MKNTFRLVCILVSCFLGIAVYLVCLVYIPRGGGQWPSSFYVSKRSRSLF